MPANNCHPQLPSHLSTRQVGRTTPSMSLHEKTLVAGVIVGFGILHVVGATMLQSAAAQSPIENAMPVQHGD
jgi:hypothetical protein